MQFRLRAARGGLARRPGPWRFAPGGRSFHYAIRFFEFCLLAGILLAFAAGMMRIR